eukprot:Clim_evm1s9 gene=Clim_evmTU1s9
MDVTEDIEGDEYDQTAKYRRRWVMLTLFAMGSATSAIIWITFSPINSLTQTYYGVNNVQVNALSIVFMAAYVPSSLASNWIFEKFGARPGLLGASVLNCISALLRFISTESNAEPRGDNAYVILIVGQTVGAIAQPFFTNMPARVAGVWFPLEERDIATVIAALANVVGIGIGSILPTAFTTDDDNAVNMFDLLLTELVIVIASLLLSVIFFEEKPPLPPSQSEVNKVNDKQLKLEFKQVLRDRNFLVLLVAFGVGLGFFNALTTLVEQIVDKSGYSSNDAGTFSAVLLGCGLVGAIFTGIVLDRCHAYNLFLRGYATVAAAAIVIFLAVLRPNNFAAITIMFAIMGTFMLPLLPIAFECGVECTFPVSEDLTTGLLMSAGQVFGIIFIFALGKLLDEESLYGSHYVFEPAYIMITVVAVFFAGCTWIYDGPYLRLQADGACEDRDSESNPEEADVRVWLDDAFELGDSSQLQRQNTNKKVVPV